MTIKPSDYLFDVKKLEICNLTLQWLRYFNPVGAQRGGGSIEPLRKPLSHLNFAMKFTPYMYAL